MLHSAVKELADDVCCKLRSSVAITSTSQCIEELVLNAIDAAATCIAIRVDLDIFRIQVVDNGTGISKEDLKLIGTRYATSKCHSIKDLDSNLTYYGFRGEALASTVQMGRIVEITSRFKNSIHTYSKLFTYGKEKHIIKCDKVRPSSGTSVTVQDFLYNIPVRRKLIKESIDIENIRIHLESIAIIHPNISFSLRNDKNSTTVLQTHKARCSLDTFICLFGKDHYRNMAEIFYSLDQFTVSGYISTQPHQCKSLQFIYINKRLILSTKIHRLMNELMGRSSVIRSKAQPYPESALVSGKIPASPPKGIRYYGIFFLNIECSRNEYDICLEPRKTSVEFKDWEKLLLCIEEMMLKFAANEGVTISLDERFRRSGKETLESSMESPLPHSSISVLKAFCNTKTNNGMNSNGEEHNLRNILITDMKSTVHSLAAQREKTIMRQEETTASNQLHVPCVPATEIAEHIPDSNTKDNCKVSHEPDVKNFNKHESVIGTVSLVDNSCSDNGAESRSLFAALKRASMTDSNDPKKICTDNDQRLDDSERLINTSKNAVSSIQQFKTAYQQTCKPSLKTPVNRVKPSVSPIKHNINKPKYDSSELSVDLYYTTNKKKHKKDLSVSGLSAALSQKWKKKENEKFVVSSLDTFKFMKQSSSKDKSFKASSCSSFKKRKTSVTDDGSYLRVSEKSKSNDFIPSSNDGDQSFQFYPVFTSKSSQAESSDSFTSVEGPGQELSVVHTEKADAGKSSDVTVGPISLPSSICNYEKGEHITYTSSKSVCTDVSDNVKETTENGALRQDSRVNLVKSGKPVLQSCYSPDADSRISAIPMTHSQPVQMFNVHKNNAHLPIADADSVALTQAYTDGSYIIHGKDSIVTAVNGRHISPTLSFNNIENINCVPAIDTQYAEPVHSCSNTSQAEQVAVSSSSSMNQHCYFAHPFKDAENNKIPVTNACDAVPTHTYINSNLISTGPVQNHTEPCSKPSAVEPCLATNEVNNPVSITGNTVLYHNSNIHLGQNLDRNACFGSKDRESNFTNCSTILASCMTPLMADNTGKEMRNSDQIFDKETVSHFSTIDSKSKDCLFTSNSSFLSSRTEMVPSKTSRESDNSFHTCRNDGNIQAADGLKTYKMLLSNGALNVAESSTAVLENWSGGRICCPSENVSCNINDAIIGSQMQQWSSDQVVGHGISRRTAHFDLVIEKDTSNSMKPTEQNCDTLIQQQCCSKASSSSSSFVPLRDRVDCANAAEACSVSKNLEGTLSSDSYVSTNAVLSTLAEHEKHQKETQCLTEHDCYSELVNSGLNQESSLVPNVSQISTETHLSLNGRNSDKHSNCQKAVVSNTDVTRPDTFGDGIVAQSVDGPWKAIPLDNGKMVYLNLRNGDTSFEPPEADPPPLGLGSQLVGYGISKVPIIHKFKPLEKEAIIAVSQNCILNCTENLTAEQCDESDGSVIILDKSEPVDPNHLNMLLTAQHSKVSKNLDLHHSSCENCSMETVSDIPDQNVTELFYTEDKSSQELPAYKTGTDNFFDTCVKNIDIQMTTEKQQRSICNLAKSVSKRLPEEDCSVLSECIPSSVQAFPDCFPDAADDVLVSSNSNSLLPQEPEVLVTKEVHLQAKQCDDPLLSPAVDEALNAFIAENSDLDILSKYSEGDSGNHYSNYPDMARLCEEWEVPFFAMDAEILTSVNEERERASNIKAYNIVHPYKFNREILKDCQVLGQVDKKFIAVAFSYRSSPAKKKKSSTDTPYSLIALVDQHAADERVQLERIIAASYSENSDVRELKRSQLNTPVEISFRPDEVRIMKSYRSAFLTVGLEFTQVNDESVFFHSLPYCLVPQGPSEKTTRRCQTAVVIVEAIVKEMCHNIRVVGGISQQQSQIHRPLPKPLLYVLNTVACKSAIKFGDTLSLKECQNLMTSLSNCQLPFQCAHGRPSLVPIVDLNYLKPMQKAKTPDLKKLKIQK